ncbi:MAG: RNA-binding S4 domain-containing protein [Parvibaculum sp.]|uniref:RNA-binding S4 domain-containing protein n=1 Tax=Parvibaculum sp. TaxID=2024848 RepID=UPI0025D5C71E|nr:RNA-binding S4 domain-containing protein [Parvibaculum sp.]MCE9651192.1 RNA-binding S4 domain-containing protein [Parvibaculum sp.]
MAELEQRIDRWLWFTRLIKSRTLAATLVTSGKLRLNGERIAKPSRNVKPGDVLTFPIGHHVRVIKVLAPGTRRGPAPEAQTLYEDLAPPEPHKATAPDQAAVRDAGSGRPTKRERRQTDAFHGLNDDS